MDTFKASAITHMHVVSDLDKSRAWYTSVLGASIYGEYGGTSVVLDLMGTWLLIVTGGPPTPDKPTVTLAPPPDPDRASTHAPLLFLSGAGLPQWVWDDSLRAGSLDSSELLQLSQPRTPRS